MRKILKIARLELSILFYSPVAWLVLSIFMIQCGITFLENLQNIRTSLSLGYQTQPITGSLFSAYGLFTSITGYIYLYLPILTMGLMSRETSSGSIKLLLSSPVKLRQIILGKYLAIISYGLALIGVLMIFATIGGIFIKNADLGLIASGLLSLYLLICTYAAIGLFMSCLTTYQVVAAISTLAVFAIMRYVGTIGQDINFIRDLTYFLSISGRTEKMIGGMITTKDVFYYLIIIASFLSLCVLRLKSERELKPWTVKAARYVLLACVALCLGFVTSRPMFTGYLDTTDLQSLTITKTSQAIAAKVKERLKVTTYVNMLAPNLWYVLPQARNSDLNRLEPFKRFIPGMDVDYVYYYKAPTDPEYQEYQHNPNLKGITQIDAVAKQMATTMGVDGDLFIKPVEIDKQINLEPEGNLLIRKLEYKGKSTILRFYNSDSDPYAGEAEVSAALKRLLVKAPKAIFITGNNERNVDSKADRDYNQISAIKTRRKALINQGFEVDTVNLSRQDIPADADVLVLADPTTSFDAAARQKLAAYINKGGNMLITGEPGRQQILNPVLAQLGIRLKPGMLVKPDRDLTPGFVNAQISPAAFHIDSNLVRMQKNGVTITMQGAAGIESHAGGDFKVEPLLMSSPGGWNKQFADEGININKVQRKSVLRAPVKPVSSVLRGASGSLGALLLAADPLATDTTRMLKRPVLQVPVKPSGSVSGSASGRLGTLAAAAGQMGNDRAGLLKKPVLRVPVKPAGSVSGGALGGGGALVAAAGQVANDTARVGKKPVLRAPVKPASSVSGGALGGASSGLGAAVFATGPGEDHTPNMAPKLGSVDLATADLRFNAATGDEKGIFPIAVALTRTVNGKQQRIVVSGDADFISNGELARSRSRFNEYYLQGLFRWFSKGAFPIDVTRPPARDTDIKISRGQITALMWLCKGIIPVLIATLGGIILFKRRRN